jgi:hypothetical protein
MLTRRAWFQTAVAGGATLLMTQRLAASMSKKQEILVFKKHNSPCCSAWMAHLRQNGFTVRERPVFDLPAVKAEYRIPEALIACHTAVVSGYIVEGHVPADLIHQLLEERKLVGGIAVAGAPAGAPGFETSGTKEPYSVVLFYPDGTIEPYAKR